MSVPPEYGAKVHMQVVGQGMHARLRSTSAFLVLFHCSSPELSVCVSILFVAMFHVPAVFKHAVRRATMRGSAAFHASARRGGDKFRVLGLQQIAVGGLDKGKLANLWVNTLGLTNTGTYKSDKENVDEDILSLGNGPSAVEVDIMQPLDPNKAPKVHVPQLNHIGLWVDDIHNAVAELTEKGMRFTPGGVRKGASGHLVTFIHPKGNDEFPLCGEGVLIELVQAPEDVIAFYKP